AHTCALLADGTSRCWGRNDYGQLGNPTNAGTTNANAAPLPVQALIGPHGGAALAAGYSHTCARLADGTARCWGDNHDGQLGNPTNSGTLIPNPAPLAVIITNTVPLSNAVALAAGSDHTCALLADGTARCWGYNFKGQLGNPTNS